MLTTARAQISSALVIAGGHSFDTIAFFCMMDQIPGIGYDFLLQPEANRFLTDQEIIPYDVLIFYDMWKPVSESEKLAYIKLTEAGKPMLFLHHALVSYQQWPEFEKIIGGRYVESLKNQAGQSSGQSTYKHDVWLDVSIVNPEHPVTAGLQNFRLLDEVYGNYRVGEQVIPLLKTNHPESTEVIAWENRYNNSRIIYIQPGHDKNSYENPDYIQLLANAVRYLLSGK